MIFFLSEYYTFIVVIIYQLHGPLRVSRRIF